MLAAPRARQFKEFGVIDDADENDDFEEQIQMVERVAAHGASHLRALQSAATTS